MPKILVTSTNAMAYHFLLPHIKMLIDEGYEVQLACTNLTGYDELLCSQLVGKYNIPMQYIRLDRSPFNIKNINGYKDLKGIISNNSFDIIITNEPVMSIVTRLAARKHRKKGTRIIYFAHGFHFFNGAPLINWLLYYPVERFMSRFANDLVTINKEDYKRAQNFQFERVFYIPGIGLDTKKFSNVDVDRTNKRNEIGVPDKAIMMFSVGELGKRKNHEAAIRGLARTNNSNIYYVICGNGILYDYLKKLTMDLGLKERVVFLGYRSDIAEICKAADIYVFPSQREGLGIGALEGMAAGLPLIASYINGIKDYAEEEKTGYCVKPNDFEGFANAMNKLAKDKELREKMGNYNVEAVKRYDLKNVKSIIKDIITESVGSKLD